VLLSRTQKEMIPYFKENLLNLEEENKVEIPNYKIMALE
jgi:hypothetical protein